MDRDFDLSLLLPFSAMFTEHLMNTRHHTPGENDEAFVELMLYLRSK